MFNRVHAIVTLIPSVRAFVIIVSLYLGTNDDDDCNIDGDEDGNGGVGIVTSVSMIARCECDNFKCKWISQRSKIVRVEPNRLNMVHNNNMILHDLPLPGISHVAIANTVMSIH
jgi:hypothetical protein